MDCEDCRHLTVVGLHDTGPWYAASESPCTSTTAVSGCFRFPLRQVWFSHSETRSLALKESKCETAFAKPCLSASHAYNRLDGLVVKASAWKAEDLGFESHLRRDFSRSSHTSDLKIVTPVATLQSAWRNGVSAGTGRPGVSILGEVESLICNFYLSVAARKPV